MDNVANIKELKQFNKEKMSAEDKKHAWLCYGLLALPIIGFFVFRLYPIFWAVRLSWFSYTGVSSETRFVAWDNYKTLFTVDANYWRSWLFTFKYAIIKVPIEACVAFITAYFLCKEPKGVNFFRSVYYLPAIFSVAIIALMFSNIFDNFGVVNGLLRKAGLISNNIDWFSKSGTALFALLLGGWWNSLGVNILYFMAALANVPKELYESAELDGANEFQKIIHITAPMIAPIFQILLLLSINGCLHVSEYVLLLSNGSPGGATHTIGSYMISKIVPGFGQVSNIGYASCMSFISSIFFCLIALGYTKLSKKLQNLY